RDGVEIYNDQGLNQALRLTPTEAGALLLTLESLEDMPGLIDTTAVHSAAAKLRAIMDDKTAAIYDSLSQGPADNDNNGGIPTKLEESATQKLLAQAVEQRRRVEFDYWSASRNAESHRVVDPARIFIVEDEPYLVAWDDEVSDHRRFRIDRMRNVNVLEEKAQPRLRHLQFDASDPFGLGQGQRVQLEIHPEFMWLANVYNIELGEVQDNGCVAAEMPIGSEEWFIRFALSQADRLRVVGPESLVNAVADRGARGNERYTREDPL
ncbi:MAG: WYL domain-containing protein, partial [Corynebacterium camporealensis]|uniref:helix-turn-helix transcriptional regulator n=1 Tax=Corynebacterium camporealensis TaxID=161896 RepID=UPI002A90D2CC